MIVHLPDRRVLVVDVKTPLDAYLEAVDAKDEESRRAALQRHARTVRAHVRELAARRYWEHLEESPEFVILFIPGDQFLSAALEQDPRLLEDAMREQVMLATPSSFVALLKAVAYGWRQHRLDVNAARVRELRADAAQATGDLHGASRRARQGVARQCQCVQQSRWIARNAGPDHGATLVRARHRRQRATRRTRHHRGDAARTQRGSEEEPERK